MIPLALGFSDISVSRDGDVYMIRSANIEAVVRPIETLSLPDDPVSLAAELSAIEDCKEADDQRAYRQTLEELSARSRTAGYFGSEQHRMYAVIAAARSDFRIGADYFLTHEPFGGTAGSGPKLLRGGRTGEILSTIALAHDSDWFYGRYLAAGPLSALAEVPEGDLVYLALVGLVDAEHAALWAKAATRNPFYARPTEQERRALDSTALYAGARGPSRFSLAPRNPSGLLVRFSERFVRAHNRGRLRSATPLPLHTVPFPDELLLPKPL